MIRVAEQAECYDEMLELILPIVKLKTLSLDNDERTLFAVACKNYVSKERTTYRTIKAIMGFLTYRNKRDVLIEYQFEVARRYDTQCMKIVDLIDQFVLEPEKENKKPNLEGLAFFLKLKADFYRYICESADDVRLTELKVLAKKTYLAANEI